MPFEGDARLSPGFHPTRPGVQLFYAFVEFFACVLACLVCCESFFGQLLKTLNFVQRYHLPEHECPICGEALSRIEVKQHDLVCTGKE